MNLWVFLKVGEPRVGRRDIGMAVLGNTGVPGWIRKQCDQAANNYFLCLYNTLQFLKKPSL